MVATTSKHGSQYGHFNTWLPPLPGPHTGPLIGTLEKMVLFNSEIKGGKTDVFPVENEGYA